MIDNQANFAEISDSASDKQRTTSVNPSSAESQVVEPRRITSVNPKGDGSQSETPQRVTSVNNNAVGANSVAPQGRVTSVNPASSSAAVSADMQRYQDDNADRIIDGKYRIISEITSKSGEADIYLCEGTGDGQRYCLKHYRRKEVRNEVQEILSQLNAPFVARLVDWGKWEERTYEVWPFFEKGSLSGKKFSEDEVETYIKQMNEALHAVHQCGLVHQDIKPDNFMFDAYDNLALIDFGISAASGSDGRTHVTQVGRTTAYSAPEVLMSKFCWPASDYYSLGVTLYELLMGNTPFALYDENMIQQRIEDVQRAKVPNIEQLSVEMQHLIRYLLRYERDKRWGYTQICDWVRGDYQKWRDKAFEEPVSAPIPSNEKEFKFAGNSYWIPSQIPNLITSMAYRWDIGMNLFDSEGRFARLVSSLQDIPGTEDIYAICNAPKRDRTEDSRVNYFRKLYEIYPELKLFTWRQYQYESKVQLGEAILASLWQHEIKTLTNTADQNAFTANNEKTSVPDYAELVYWARNNICSMYLEFTGDKTLAVATRKLESGVEQDITNLYRIAYLLSNSTKVRLPFGEFQNKDELKQYVERVISACEETGSTDAFLGLCTDIYDGKNVNVGFRAWAERMGDDEAIRILTAN